jgi:hypothetical protein
MKQTLKEAGYTYVRYSSILHAHILKDEDGKLELWVANKNHASYGLIYKNTHLEFASSYVPLYGVSVEDAKAVLE